MAATYYLSKGTPGNVLCGCAGFSLSAAWTAFLPQPCIPYTPLSLYVTRTFIPDNIASAGFVSPSNWAFSISEPSATGTLYTAAGCATPAGGISGFSASFVITEAAGTYTITGTSDGTVVFTGSGPIATPIANTVIGATGTIELNT